MNVPQLFYTPVPRDLLKLTGRDRQSFLQGMVTNDVARLSAGEGCYAFMLDATGHVLADMHVLNVGEYLLLDLEPGMAPFVAETLEKYLIMEKCRISPVEGGYGVLAVGGSAVGQALERLGVADANRFATGSEGTNAVISPQGGDAVVAATNPASVPVCRIYDPEMENRGAAYIASFAERGAVEVPVALLEGLRIEAGIPRFGVDIEKSVLAPETGQRARAISFRKGCYIGQEIVARIDARGHTNKGLTGFALDPALPLPERNTPVFAEGKEVGRITSVVVSPTLGTPIALGYLRNEQATPGAFVAVASADGPMAMVAALPFVGGTQAVANP